MIWREANILQRFDFAGLASGPHVWRGVLRKKWFTTGEGQQIKWNYRCTGTKSNQQCAALGEAAIPSPTIQANVQKEKKTEKIVSFGRELFAYTPFLTLAYEGIVVVEKVCTLENSVQLKLAVVCRLARHNHWKKETTLDSWFIACAGIVENSCEGGDINSHFCILMDSKSFWFGKHVLWFSSHVRIYLRRRHLMSMYSRPVVGGFKVAANIVAVYIYISMIYQQNIAKYILQYLMSKYSRPVVGGSFKVASCSTDVN